MKKIFTKWMLLVASASMLTAMTACLETDDSDYIYTGYCTVSGSMENGYVLYSDYGDILYPTQSSIYSILGYTGFNGARRIWVYLTYNKDNVQTDENGKSIIRNMKYQDASKLTCMEPISLTAADSLGVTLADSIFDATIGNLWLVNGYLNAAWEAYYSLNASNKVIVPTMNLVYDDSKICADSINFTLYYNRHDSINAYNYYSTGSVVNSYDLVALANSLPASDSILISVTTPSGVTRSQRVARSDIQYPDK